MELFRKSHHKCNLCYKEVTIAHYHYKGKTFCSKLCMDAYEFAREADSELTKENISRFVKSAAKAFNDLKAIFQKTINE